MMHKPLRNQIVRLLLIALPLLSLLWLMRAGLAREQQPDLRWVVRPLEADDVVDLAAPQDGETTTVAEATHPQTGHTYRLDLAQKTLEEMDDAGQVLASYALPQLNVPAVSGIRFETSIDATDDPQAVHLYVWTEGRVFEMWPVSVSEVAPAAPQQQATLVRTTQTHQYQPPSPDPAGLTYLPDWNRLLISDSEVNEMDIYEGVNLFFTTRSGDLRDRADTTDFTDEPTGVAFNPNNDRLFITDDDDDMIFEVGLLCEDDDDDDDVPDDVSGDDVSGDDVSGDDDCDDGLSALGPTGDDDDYYFNSFRTDLFGNDDPEGITYAADHGVLYTVDGRHREVFRISPGPNGRFGDENDEVSSFDLGDLGLVDPEGIAYEPLSGNLFIVDSNVDSMESMEGSVPAVYEVTTDGALVSTIDISQANPMKPAGIVLAPASDGSGEIHLYVVDRGVDNNDDPTENDGRLYEFRLPDGVGPATPTPTLTTSPTGTPPPSGTQPPPPTATPTGTLTPEPPREHIYMPLIARNIHDEVGEPNNTCERAYPIEPGQAQAFLAEDRDDWYSFELGQDADLTVLLDNFVPQDGQIAVYRGSDCDTAMFLDNNGDSSTQKTVNLGNQPAGTYLVYVGNDGPLNQDDFYTLTIAGD